MLLGCRFRRMEFGGCTRKTEEKRSERGWLTMTINEIAKLAGVSNAAVSRYLNGGSLSEEKRNKIKTIIQKTGYVPSEYARTLRTKKSFHVAVIVPNIKSGTAARIVSGINSVLQEKNYHMVLADTDNDPVQELEYLEFFRSGQMDGMIYIASSMTDRHREILKGYHVPVVVIGQMTSEFDCVYHDDFHAAKDMMNVLLEAGCRRPGLMTVPEEDQAVGAARNHGVEAALGQRGYDPMSVPRVTAGFTLESGWGKMKELMEQNPGIDGVFCATDTLAVGAMMYLKDTGRQIPQEVKLCSVGNNQASDIVEPRLSTAHYHYRTSGVEAAKLLLARIEGKNQGPANQLMLGYQVIPRGSTGTKDSIWTPRGLDKQAQG